MICRVCGGEAGKAFDAKIMGKYTIDYFHCPECGFLETEDPYWIKECYECTINITDTGILSRNSYLSRITAWVIALFFNKSARFLDFAGGYGILTRMMRDIGFDYYWNDPYSENLVARGFEIQTSDTEFELLTSFESFEHFVDPTKELESMLQKSKSILFSTELFYEVPPKPEEWWYYGLEHGQHIAFYSIKTLYYLAKKYGLNLYTNKRNVHLFTSKKISPTIFNFIFLLNKLGLFFFAKLGLKSKTFSDMQDLIQAASKK